jgi:hypothetical protein
MPHETLVNIFPMDCIFGLLFYSPYRSISRKRDAHVKQRGSHHANSLFEHIQKRHPSGYDPILQSSDLWRIGLSFSSRLAYRKGESIDVLQQKRSPRCSETAMAAANEIIVLRVIDIDHSRP